MSGAIDMNNQAVAYLQAGYALEAMTLLRTALGLLREKLTSNRQREEQESRDREEHGDSSCLSSCSLCPSCNDPHSVRSSCGNGRQQSRPVPLTRLLSNPSLATSMDNQVDDRRSHDGTSDDGQTTVRTTNGTTYSGENSRQDGHHRGEHNIADATAAAQPWMIRGVPISLDLFRAKQQQQHFPSSCSAAAANDDKSFLPLFERALLLQPSGCQQGAQHHNHHHQQDHDLLTALVMYNIALVNHIQAIVCDYQPALLRKALKCYEMTLIFVQRLCQRGAHHVRQTYLLSLAIFYNSAVAHAHFFSLPEMRDCLACLRSILDVHGRSNLPSQGLDHEDYTFFFVNVMVLCPPGRELVLSPAA